MPPFLFIRCLLYLFSIPALKGLTMLRIVTDNASDITAAQAQELDIDIIPLQLCLGNSIYPQNTEQDFLLFYEHLMTSRTQPVISIPSPQQYLEIFLDAKKKDDDVLVLTVSSTLSDTIESACAAWRMAEHNGVFIVDTHQASIGQRLLVEMAVRLRDEGYTASEIVQRIERIRDQVATCGIVDSLNTLCERSRVSSGFTILSRAINTRRVFSMEDTALTAIANVRGYPQEMKAIFDHMAGNHLNKAYPVYFGYTMNRKKSEQLMRQTKEKFQLNTAKLHPIGGIVGAHCGKECIAVAYLKQANTATTQPLLTGKRNLHARRTGSTEHENCGKIEAAEKMPP